VSATRSSLTMIDCGAYVIGNVADIKRATLIVTTFILTTLIVTTLIVTTLIVTTLIVVH
jgi:hypothetical protein